MWRQALLARPQQPARLPDGTVGAFYPDNFTFGQTVYLSPIYAAVQDTEGVQSVTVTRFQRQGRCSTNAVSAAQ